MSHADAAGMSPPGNAALLPGCRGQQGGTGYG